MVVVLRHDHTSGLPDYFDLPAIEPTFAHPPVRQRPLVVAAGEADPWHEPGAGQNYANSNYATLGLLDEKVTGRSLADVLDARIFAPLGMRSASLRPRRDCRPGSRSRSTSGSRSGCCSTTPAGCRTTS